ncbi:MAG TPA: hypothetical protein QGF95_24765 [Candidatus Latescibacteria bacterium]|jgi:hypothetical protein|nr:hypothetical protein [Candidatus Latescibacterota bacterium]HJP33778.1 hypothetical protein [Candidatus Latescibacterota bacterium]
MSGQPRESLDIGDGARHDQVLRRGRSVALYAAADHRNVAESQAPHCLPQKIGSAAAAFHERETRPWQGDGERYGWQPGTGPHIHDSCVGNRPHRGPQRKGRQNVAVYDTGEIVAGDKVHRLRPPSDQSDVFLETPTEGGQLPA